MADLPNPLRLIRHRDLLVVDVECTNLEPSPDGARLVRTDPDAPARITLRFPAQHVAERAFFETQIPERPDPPRPGEPVAQPPAAEAMVAGPSRLVFTLPDGVQAIELSVAGLLDWAALEPRLAPGALPAGTTEGPPPAIPAADETALEFPYRLLLSPDATAHWVHRAEPFEAGGATELWHTRMAAAGRRPNVRALGRRPRGDAIRGSLSDRDLDEIVLLSADFDVRAPTAGRLASRRLLAASGLAGLHMEPLPLEVERFMMTALGASARLRGAWTYPPIQADPAVLTRFGMPAPSLQQYEHISGQGRDQFVRVVRRGLVSSGHRASLVKVTERRFEPKQLRTENTPQGPIGIFGADAYLRQYFQVVIQEPVLDYATLAAAYAHGGREMPLRSLRLTTLVTPHIDFPLPGLAAVEAQARADLLIPDSPKEEEIRLQRERHVQEKIEAAFTDPFWIRVGEADFEFGAVGMDWEGHPTTMPLPLLFIPYEVLKRTSATSEVIGKFVTGPASRRTRPLGGQRVAVADPAGSARGSTRLPASSLTFTLQPLAGPVPATYRPGWVMAVTGAELELESVARITGRTGPVAATFDATYLDRGLAPEANAAGVFARLAAPQPLKFAGERGGGLARPDAAIDVLSSRNGAMPAAFAGPAMTQAQIDALFGAAKLFGSIALKDVLPAPPPTTAADFAFADLAEEQLQALLDGPQRQPRVPILRSRELVRDGVPYAVEARFVWKPDLRAAQMLDFTADSVLVLDARTVTPLDGGEATSELRGELRNFALQFAGVIRISFERLAFVARPGRKPDITAEGFELQFLGPLQFINTLQEVLPQDGFSDPPAISVSPAGISAGYSLAIPTVGVGIFSLQNLSLGAALAIPFNDQPASFRFAISERHHPFIVTVSLFGGGGFFALGVGAKGVESIEAAIEFGGNIALNLGVASGGVSVMAGVYFGMTGQTTTLTGYLRVNGYLSVLGLISLSVEFYLAFTYRDKGGGRSEIWGQATVTVSVKVAFISKSVSLSIERRFAGAAGDPTFEQLVEPDDWERYCLAFAG